MRACCVYTWHETRHGLAWVRHHTPFRIDTRAAPMGSLGRRVRAPIRLALGMREPKRAGSVQRVRSMLRFAACTQASVCLGSGKEGMGAGPDMTQASGLDSGLDGSDGRPPKCKRPTYARAYPSALGSRTALRRARVPPRLGISGSGRGLLGWGQAISGTKSPVKRSWAPRHEP